MRSYGVLDSWDGLQAKGYKMQIPKLKKEHKNGQQ